MEDQPHNKMQQTAASLTTGNQRNHDITIQQ